MMTISERKAAAEVDLARLYLQREQVQMQLNALQQQAQQIQVAMLEKDGEIKAYSVLAVEEGR